MHNVVVNVEERVSVNPQKLRLGAHVTCLVVIHRVLVSPARMPRASPRVDGDVRGVLEILDLSRDHLILRRVLEHVGRVRRGRGVGRGGTERLIDVLDVSIP